MDEATLLKLTQTTGCAPCQERMATQDTDPPQPEARWSGVIGVEGELTGDGRLIELGALRWDTLPLPLRYVSQDMGAHDGAMVVGKITDVTRDEDTGAIRAEGTLDTNSEAGREAMRHISDGLTDGVSMDLDDVSFEVRVAKDALDAQLETPDTDADPDEDGRVTVVGMNSDDEVMVTLSGRIRAATIVAIPAFESARIAITDGATSEPDALAAGATPKSPPREWFADPALTGPTALTVTEDGRVFGHLAVWNTCHVAHSHSTCIKPPKSPSGYRYFRVGSVLTSDGSEVATGRLTLGTKHATGEMSAAQATAHYENTGAAVADVSAGEDEFGIWVAGSVRSNVSPDKVKELRASPLSGDWRRIGGALELVGALAVNVPGFPIPRPAGMVASGTVTTLVASGMVAPRRVIAPGEPGALSTEDLRYLKKLAMRMKADDLRRRVTTATATV